uniref:60S ribosomal export protein NMD3 n=1 Tax=Elphidium margaritaceum TaxID=933848 RepID=A0A7S0TE99_9EUKA|mmetsp:Transcript_1654/g.3250  ORF Transcript_1654/g.3250 Transcript_1654/m.3250 type:complete len:581 (+) Transcript_1654:47-1789(+)
MDIDEVTEFVQDGTNNWTPTVNDVNNLKLHSRPNDNNNNNNDDDDTNYILCPMCQTPIKPNAVNLCIHCLNSRYDIAQGISRELIVFQCRQCERWFKNPQFVSAELESAVLLEVLLKKIAGINRKEVKLVNAAFVWTEPHSKRIKVKLTIQKEVVSNAIVEKSFEVTFSIENQQCLECQRSFTHHTWKSCVQLRQKVNHKRTFLFLEQLILKYNMGQLCMGIKEQRDGIDFYFNSKNAGYTFLNFLHSITILETRQNAQSKRLISHDHKSNVANFKYSMYAELPPICRNDLCLIPLKLQKKCGGHSPLMLCYKVTTMLHFVDPTSLHTIELDAKQYFRYFFKSISNVKHLTVFYVMALNPMRHLRKGKWKCAEVELCREHDLGDDQAPVLETVTHIGGVIKEGDMVLGYDLEQLSTHDDLHHNADLKKFLKRHKMPDVVIVKKHYPYYSKSVKRNWKLKSMVKERDYNVDKHAAEKEQLDNELFMREIEEDFDLRCQIKVYKDQTYKAEQQQQLAEQNEDMPAKIPEHELIDEFVEMKLEQENAQQNESKSQTEGHGDQHNEHDDEEDNENEDDDMVCIE